MSDEIKVGDRVSWLHKPKYGRDKTPRPMTGTVRRLHVSRKAWAGVDSDGEGHWGGSWVVLLAELTRLTDTALVRTVAALAVDDDPFRIVCTDYELAAAWAITEGGKGELHAAFG